MGNLILFSLLILLLVFAQFTTEKTVDEIIDKHVKVRGGLNKLLAVNSICMEGFKETNGERINIKIIKEQGKLSRTEITTSIAFAYVMVTHEGAWSFFPHTDITPNKFAAEALPDLQIEMDIAGPLINYSAKENKVALLGKEMMGDNKCYKIQLITKEKKEIIYWIDTITYLIKQTTTLPIGAKRGFVKETITTYNNYKTVDGIQFAYSSETQTQGVYQETFGGEIIFHHIQLNQVLNTDLYQPT